MKKICVVTGSRAEYGLLKPLLTAIDKEKNWKLQLLVTGMHLSPEFGLTYTEIENDGFSISKKIDILLSSDSASGIVKSMGIGLISFADAFKELKPDLIIVLGDRFEILTVVEAALILKIPVAHIHGGEITEGAFDDSIRHAITKMSHLHFASTEESRCRIIQMGENPDLVFNTGAIGLDSIKNLRLLSKSDIENKLKISFKKYNYLVTFHPATLSKSDQEKEFSELLSAIVKEKDSLFIITKSNADTSGRSINKMIDDFIIAHKHNFVAYSSMGQLLYLSTMQYVDAVIGNSSSGIVEAPSFKVATINIGSRQKGRIQAQNVINCLPVKNDIQIAIKKIKEPSFKSNLKKIENPYGSGNTVALISKALKNKDWKKLIPKKFYDVKFV